MNAPNFVMLMQSERAKSLLDEYPVAFLLLTIIAYRANDKGEAFIGREEFKSKRYKGRGISPQQVKTSLNYLATHSYLTSTSTNKGTIVKILDSTVYNVSKKPINQLISQLSTSYQPLTKIEDISSSKDSDILPFIGIETDLLELWKKAFPDVDIESELRKMCAWLMNPDHSHKERIGSFISRWLSSSQEKARDLNLKKNALLEIRKSTHMHPQGATNNYKRMEEGGEF